GPDAVLALNRLRADYRAQDRRRRAGWAPVNPGVHPALSLSRLISPQSSAIFGAELVRDEMTMTITASAMRPAARRVAAALLAVATLAGAAAATTEPAEARNGRNGAAAAGLLGELAAGLLIGGAAHAHGPIIDGPPPSMYYEPPPPRVYYRQ